MPLPNEPCGSLPRSSKLQSAYADYDAGKISKSDLEALQDEAVQDSLERMEATGQEINCDGEQRWSSFATYPITDTMTGTGLVDTLGDGGQIFALFPDGHYRKLPKLVKGPFKYKNYAAESTKKAVALAKGPVKQAVIAPSMLALLYPLDSEVKGYTHEQFYDDLVKECVKDVKMAFAAGAARVSIDFTEGRLACKKDSNNPWTGAGMLPLFIDLINRVLGEFTAEQRLNIGVHTCPGSDCTTTHSLDVDYVELLPDMFRLNAGYFLIQAASENDKEYVYKLIGENRRDDANGVPQTCFIGVIDPINPEVERPQDICRRTDDGSAVYPRQHARRDRRLWLPAVQQRSKTELRITRHRAGRCLQENHRAFGGCPNGVGEAGSLVPTSLRDPARRT